MKCVSVFFFCMMNLLSCVPLASDEEYIFSHVEEEVQRMKILNTAYNGNSLDALTQNVEAGINMLEFGCGNLELAEELMSKVPNIHYTCIDPEKRISHFLSSFYNRFEHVRLLEGGVEELDKYVGNESFDVIYGRWVLEPV